MPSLGLITNVKFCASAALTGGARLASWFTTLTVSAPSREQPLSARRSLFAKESAKVGNPYRSSILLYAARPVMGQTAWDQYRQCKADKPPRAEMLADWRAQPVSAKTDHSARNIRCNPDDQRVRVGEPGITKRATVSSAPTQLGQNYHRTAIG